jgi:hypothetical protein
LKFVHRTSFVVLAVLTVGTIPARADPITAIYDVQVLQRDLLLGDPEPFSQQFELRMSFDPDASSEANIYGPASFSSVPLTVPEVPADLLPLRQISGDTQHRLSDGTVSAGARQFEHSFVQNEQTQREYVQITRLIGIFASPPVTLTAENFPAHLGTKPLDSGNFFFTQWTCIGALGERCFDDPSRYLKSYVEYSGIATLREVESPVVPEPATLALVGGGLALLAAKRRRRGR